MAIECYKAALQILSREDYPYEWAGAMVNLGQSYSQLMDGDVTINLEKAIVCSVKTLLYRQGNLGGEITQ
jgi:hypothetical protein